MTDASIQALRRELLSSPRLFPLDQSQDGQTVHFVRLDEEDYRRTSFMDQRMLREAAEAGRALKSGNVPWDLLYPWAEELSVRCHFLFHVSHAGSTMLARMLGEHPNCLSLREPWILRTLAHSPSESRLRCYLSLWSRTFRPEQRAFIKATSFVSQIGPDLMRLDDSSKALLMFVPAETFLAAVLDGSMSDIDSSAENRMARLSTQVSSISRPLSEMTSGEKAAMSWLVEMESLRSLHREFPQRTLLVDFDLFLQDTEQQLGAIASWLGLFGHEQEMLNSPSLTRYAKKLDVPYDARFRQRLLNQSRVKHKNDIEAGLRWLEQAAANVGGDKIY